MVCKMYYYIKRIYTTFVNNRKSNRQLTIKRAKQLNCEMTGYKMSLQGLDIVKKCFKQPIKNNM